jgi:hypothetical protein
MRWGFMRLIRSDGEVDSSWDEKEQDDVRAYSAKASTQNPQTRIPFCSFFFFLRRHDRDQKPRS